MTIKTETDSKQARQKNLDAGWRGDGGGWFFGPLRQAYLSQNYEDYAEQQRARWDLLHYLQVVVQQLLSKRKNSPKK
jgi:hypothetical protein